MARPAPRTTLFGTAYLTRASHTPIATVLRAATILASDVEGLRLVLASTVIGERYSIEVPDDGSEVRLRRRT